MKEQEIKKLMQKLDISYSEAVELWECDNDLSENEEQKQLQKTAEKVKIKHGTVNKKSAFRKPREVIDLEKRELIKIISKGLEKAKIENTVTNPQKIIEFIYNGNYYKLDLIKRRVKNV